MRRDFFFFTRESNGIRCGYDSDVCRWFLHMSNTGNYRTFQGYVEIQENWVFKQDDGGLPDTPLNGSGSLSDWMGRAGVLRREAAPVRSHAQHRTHSTERSARGSSIPTTTLWSQVSPQKILLKAPTERLSMNHWRLGANDYTDAPTSTPVPSLSVL